jgi:peptide/nickel transport system permease protein
LYLIDSILAGDFPFFVDALKHLVLPATALALLAFAYIARVTRASMLETMGKDFVRTAKAKGLPRRTVIFRHTLRNALISTTTIIGLVFQYLLTGSVVIETIFFWPGVGSYAARSVLALDLPSIMGVTVLFTVVVVITNLVTDILYAFLDPTVRL